MSSRYERHRFNADNKRYRPRAGIIMMTGGLPADDEMKALEEHELFYLVKPIDPFQMKAIMEEFLGKRIGTYQDYNFLMASICGKKRLHNRQPFTNSGQRQSLE